MSKATGTLNDIRILGAGLAFGESPRWHDGRLYFVDFGTREVSAVDLEGKRELIARTDDMPMGIDFLPGSRLIAVSIHDAKLLCREADGSLTTWADLATLSTKPWGELVVDGPGNAYVGNIGFQFPGGEFAPGSIALVTHDGNVRRVAEGLAFPNGMSVTPDQNTLIVAESCGERLTAFDIGVDGGLSNQRLWAKTPGDHPDGISLDAEGAVWYADVGTRLCVRVREGGEVLQVVVDRGCLPACSAVLSARRCSSWLLSQRRVLAPTRRAPAKCWPWTSMCRAQAGLWQSDRPRVPDH